MENRSHDQSNDREEGEIVDDDLEAISDDSIIITPRMGKLHSSKESLRALSLSSVSDMEVVDYSPKPSLEKRKIRRRSSASSKKRKNTKHHHRKSRSDSGSDCDEDMVINKKLLHEAIRIDSKEAHNKSLRTRLRGMVAKPFIIETIEIDSDKSLPNNSPDINSCTFDSPVYVETISTEIPSLPNEQVSEKKGECQDSPVEQDNELIQLRLAALKTAVMNKFEHRKKKKINAELLSTPIHLEINKENSPDNVNAKSSTTEGEIINCPVEISENIELVTNSVNNSEEDEDEDILRAVLLASIAKKITNEISPPNFKKGKVNINSKKIGAPVPGKVESQHCRPPFPKVKSHLNIPKIPRFVISVNNSDSNSDDNMSKEDIEEKITKKRQEKVPDIQKEVENEVEKFLKQQRAEVEAKQKQPVKTPEPTVKPTIQVGKTNSIYKLLPKNKQLEYEKLIQKIRSAEKKPRMRKPSHRTLDSKNTIKSVRTRTTSRSVEIKTITDNKNELTGVLQRSLKEMQAQLNGRLQIKGKYHILTPLMKKMNAASQEQKKHELRIKHLLNQLKEARNQCQKSQQTLHDLLNEFFQKKEEIDKRPPKGKIISQLVTSTPKSETKSEAVGDKNKVSKLDLPASTLPKLPNLIKPKENLPCKVVLEKCPVNLTDPNDIEFKKFEIEEAVAMPKYTSPLDNAGSLSNKPMNPLKILCPFEINGSCRDMECNFNHCS